MISVARLELSHTSRLLLSAGILLATSTLKRWKQVSSFGAHIQEAKSMVVWLRLERSEQASLMASTVGPAVGGCWPF